MRRNGQPSLPSAMTCCFFDSFKTLLMPTEPIGASIGVYVGFLTRQPDRIVVMSNERIAVPSRKKCGVHQLILLSKKSGLFLLRSLELCLDSGQLRLQSLHSFPFGCVFFVWHFGRISEL